MIFISITSTNLCMFIRKFNPVLCCCSITKLCPTICDPMDCSMPGFPLLQYLRVCTNSCPLSQWCYLSISSSAALFSFAFNLFQHQGFFPMSQLFTSSGKSIVASASATVLPMRVFRTEFLENWLVGSPCSPRDSQESSPASQFESINSSALSLLYGSTLTSVHDYWKTNSFDYIYGPLSAKWCLCFLMCCLGLLELSFQGASVF